MADEFKNVRISILKHFEDNLSFNTDFDGVDFDTDAVTEWMRPRLLGGASAAARRTERNEIWTLQVDCFAKVGEDSAGSQQENIHRAWELADEVVGVFSQADVPVKDWAGVGDPIIAYMRFEEADVIRGPEPKTHTSHVVVTLTGALIFAP